MTKFQKPGSSILMFFFLLIAAGSICSESVEAQPETVKYPPLRAEMNQWDCDDPAAPRETFCRVKQIPAADKITKHFADGKEGAWSENDSLTLVYRTEADSVEAIVGGAVFPLVRIAGTDFWAITLKAPWLERGIVSYRFIVTQSDKMKVDPPVSRFVWRGANAPAPIPQSKNLQGRLTEETLQSTNLSETRKLTVYSPPMRRGEKPSVVIYVADGELVNELAPYVETLITSRQLPPVLLVGVHAADQLPNPDPRVGDLRAIEYLVGGGYTSERFEKHERFFVNEVVAWAESKYNAPKAREKRGIYGISNGGAFAIAMGAKHSDIFGHIFGFSNDSRSNLLMPEWSGKQSPPVYYLVNGLWEFRLRGLAAYAEVLRNHGARVTYVMPIAEHDRTMWDEQFAKALLLHFG